MSILAIATAEQWLAFLTPLAIAISIVMQQVSARRAEREIITSRLRAAETAFTVQSIKADIHENTTKTAETAAKLNKVAEDVEVVHHVVNGPMAAKIKEIADLTATIAQLRGTKADHVAARDAEVIHTEDEKGRHHDGSDKLAQDR